MEASVEQLKQRSRATWAAGDFDAIAQQIWDVGQKLVDRVGVEPGMRVLDVACGTGNATIPAALAGGRCTGLDLTPELFEDGRRHAADAGVEIEWIEGDAEAMAVPEAGFDRVLSSFGVMFAPRHQVAAAELARVCAPGGVVGLCAWTPDGFNGEMFKMVGSRMPAPPSYASPPVLWGSEPHVRSLLEPLGFSVEVERLDAIFRGATVEEIVGRMETKFGPWLMAQAALGDDWPALRAELVDLYTRNSTAAGSGGVEAAAEYLRVIARKTS
jgi:SAM-dependent methyltransferase